MHHSCPSVVAALMTAFGIPPNCVGQDVRPIAGSVGPAVGHVSAQSARIWFRSGVRGTFEVRIHTNDGAPVFTASTVASADNDFCMVWDAANLSPSRHYRYDISNGGADTPIIASGEFRTPADTGTPQRVTIVFGSCAGDPYDKPQPVWSEIGTFHPNVMCLIGDTPYIDSPALETQQTKYRQFFTIPELTAFRSATPMLGLWDDHDFGANDTDGTLAGKEGALQAFNEYHANSRMGDASLGIYSTCRIGAAEIFLIDARWFSGTAPSFADPAKPTLLGAAQWERLQTDLRASTATFKLLTTGMVWNGAVRKGKKDCWGMYPHELNAVKAFLAAESITGVILIGGDVHRTRVFKSPSESTGLAYPLYEFITSPLGGNVLENANVPHPNLIFDSGTTRAFLVFDVDSTVTPPLLTARFRGNGRELYSLQLKSTDLTKPN